MDIRPEYQRLQFRLRSLFLMTTALAAFFALAQTMGYVRAFLGVVAGTALPAAFLYRRHRRLLPHRLAAAALAVSVLWLVTVDLCAYFEKCHYCGSDHYLVQRRVFGLVISEWQTNVCKTFSSVIAEDLGAPCPHKNRRVLAATKWGFVWRVDESDEEYGLRIGGSVPEWYDIAMARLVRTKGKASPKMAREFREKVLFQHDHKHMGQFVHELLADKGQSGTVIDSSSELRGHNTNDSDSGSRGQLLTLDVSSSRVRVSRVKS